MSNCGIRIENFSLQKSVTNKKCPPLSSDPDHFDIQGYCDLNL